MEIIRFDLKKNRKKLVIFSLIIAFMVVFSSMIFAGFQTGIPDNSIEKIYGPSFNASGWINLSFDEESMNSTLSSFFDGSPGNSIGLKELLDKNPSYTYSCIPLNCEIDYSTINGASSKSFTLNSGGSKILGLRISSSLPVTSVSSFSMDINSNADVSSVPQLTIDILDDNETDWRAHKPREEYQEKNYGCFEEGKSDESAQITSSQYCQKISLPAFPRVKLGADIEEVTGGNVNFTLSISNDTFGIYESCAQNISGSGQVDCIVSDLKTSQLQDFFVCIRNTKTADDNKYELRYEENEPCGFTDFFNNEYTFDFEIFAQPSLYEAVGNFILNNTEMQSSGGSGNIENKILNYISEKYGGDCSDECVIPIVFRSNANNQVLVVSDASLSYTAGISATATTLYDLTETFPKISSNYQRLFIDKAAFSVPSDLGIYDFSLKLNNQEIFSEDIEIKDVPIIKFLTPKTTATGYPETFTVDVVSPTDMNISSYKWDFGDNSNIMTTPINKAVHIYSAIGIYNLEITVMDSEGFNSSKTFEINVTSAKNLIQTTLNKLNADLLGLKEDIQDQSLFQQKSLNSILNIGNISSELSRLEQEYNDAANESEYMRILGDLLKIKIPGNIFKTKQANSFLFFPERDDVDMDVLQAIGGGEYDPKRIENYKQAVLVWQQENVELRMDYNEFSGEGDSGINPIANIFEIRVDEKRDIIENYYLIVPKFENMGFNRNVEEIDGFVYVNLRDTSGISFYTSEDVDFTNLPAFVAPAIDKLTVSSTPIFSEEEKKQRVIIFILSMIFLGIAGFIAYAVIYQWYKKRYEKYLFKNRNDLYNIVTYVNNSKKKGLSNKEIIKNLKRAGWSSEQVRYVTRKYEGKRTGLVEIPLIHLMKKVKKESSHHQQKKR